MSSFLRDFVILSFCLDVIIRYDMQIILNHPCRRWFMFLFLRTLFCLCDFGLFLDSLSERRIWSPLFYFKFLQVSICKVFQGDQNFSWTVGNIVGRVKAGAESLQTWNPGPRLASSHGVKNYHSFPKHPCLSRRRDDTDESQHKNDFFNQHSSSNANSASIILPTFIS